MENIVRTVTGAYLQTCQLLGVPVVIAPHTTLNEKFGIHQDVQITDTEVPRARYVTIGNGGHRMVLGVNNIGRPEPVQHRPTDGALFNHLPFVLRETTNDLSSAERSKYRLRRLEDHAGVTYVAYYAKVLDLTNSVPQMERKTVSDGSTFSTAYEATISDLTPSPPNLSSTGVVTTSGEYVSATAKVPFTMNEVDITEFMNVCNVIYGDTNYAMLSEIALCSGVDRTVMGTFSGLTSAYTDTIGMQVISFINAFFALKFSNSGVNVTFDVGSVETLLSF